MANSIQCPGVVYAISLSYYKCVLFASDWLLSNWLLSITTSTIVTT